MEFIKQIGIIEGVLGAGILCAPLLPSKILAILDLLVIRLLTVFVILWAVTKGPLIGLLTFVFIAVLYLQRNRQKIVHARTRFAEIVEGDTAPQMTVDEEGVEQKTVPVHEFETPDDRTMYYIPKNGCAVNSDVFEPPSNTINGKIVFPAIPGGAKSADIFQKEGFAQIPGVSV